MINGALVGKLFKSSSFDTFCVTDGNRAALEACRKVALGHSAGVVLVGRVGTGKTHLLVSLARAYSRESAGQYVETENREGVVVEGYCEYQKERNVQYWPILDLVTKLREQIRNGVSYELTVAEKCEECELLIIDDFGQERTTDFVLEEIERIIDFRYRDMRPIAVATNLTMAEIHEKYGDRALSRWVQQCEIIKLTGIDYRSNKNSKEGPR